MIRDIHAKRRVADTENERQAFEVCTITEGYYRASDVRVDVVALAQLPENRSSLTLFQWSSVVDSHENDKRGRQRKAYNRLPMHQAAQSNAILFDGDISQWN